MKVDVIDTLDEYKFEHPCRNVLRAEEKFFYNPDLSNIDSIIIKDMRYCQTCACFSANHKTSLGMCQGLKIKLENKEKTSYTIKASVTQLAE